MNVRNLRRKCFISICRHLATCHTALRLPSWSCQSHSKRVSGETSLTSVGRKERSPISSKIQLYVGTLKLLCTREDHHQKAGQSGDFYPQGKPRWPHPDQIRDWGETRKYAWMPSWCRRLQTTGCSSLHLQHDWVYFSQSEAGESQIQVWQNHLHRIVNESGLILEKVISDLQKKY